MKTNVYKPRVDKLFWIFAIPITLLLISSTVLASFEPLSLIGIIPLDLFGIYFLTSSLFGYVELREETLYVKFGFFLSREIPYHTIRHIDIESKYYTESMLSIKNAVEHINIRYNSFDCITVSVVDNDGLVEALSSRVEVAKRLAF